MAAKLSGKRHYEVPMQTAASMVIRERRVTSEAIQVHGGYGFTKEFLVSRFYREACWAAARRKL